MRLTTRAERFGSSVLSPSSSRLAQTANPSGSQYRILTRSVGGWQAQIDARQRRQVLHGTRDHCVQAIEAAAHVAGSGAQVHAHAGRSIIWRLARLPGAGSTPARNVAASTGIRRRSPPLRTGFEVPLSWRIRSAGGCGCFHQRESDRRFSRRAKLPPAVKSSARGAHARGKMLARFGRCSSAVRSSDATARASMVVGLCSLPLCYRSLSSAIGVHVMFTA